MVQSAQMFHRIDCAISVNSSLNWRILLQRQMRSRAIVIVDIRPHHSAEMGFTEDEDVIETFAVPTVNLIRERFAKDCDS